MVGHTRNRILLAMALVGAVSSCDVHGISDPGELASIVVTPDATLAAGTTQQLVAVGYDAEGRVVPITPTWTVAASGGTIDGAGIFTAGSVPGVFTNTAVASVGAISGDATITVVPGALSTITVTPSPAILAIGATQQFTAVGRDGFGNVVAFTPTWTLVNGGGTLNSTGLFTAGTASGTFANTIQASNSGKTGFATVVVQPGALSSVTVTPNPATVAVNATQQFTATGRDANGNVLSTSATWSVVAGGGSISATGVFTAGNSAGTFTNTVRATIGGLDGFATVNVTDGSVASITVTPNPVAVQSGATQQFSAVGRDAGGNVVAITPVWAVVNGGGTIDPATGVFTAGATPGTFSSTIRATSGTISGFATVTVTSTPPAVVTITVTPNPASVQTNGTQQFTAVGRDGGGNIVPITPVWSVVNGGGTINAGSGLFTAGTVAGTFTNTVRATSGSVFGSASVTVTSPPVPPPAPLVNFGAAAPNGIMAGTAVTCVSLGLVNADVSISPGSTITGFPPCTITGVRNLANAIAAQAQIDLTAAYNTLAGQPCPPANAIVANLGGTTKPAGVYCTASGIGVTGTLTLDGGGNPNANFVFQAGTGLTTAGNIVLINGAQAKNVYWLVGTSATIGTGSQWQGNIVAMTSITLVDNATLFGRALARNGAVTLGTGNTITLP